MDPGDMVQVQKSFRLFEQELYNRRDSEKFHNISSLMTLPGEIYLLTKLIFHKQDYPQYDYVTIELLIAGRTWLTTITIDDVEDLNQFILKYDFKDEDIIISKAQS